MFFYIRTYSIYLFMFSFDNELCKFLFTNLGDCFFNYGIEKESLRVTKDGKLSNEKHPIALGSKLCHPFVTCDYSEALLELITPKDSSIDNSLSFLYQLHSFVYQNSYSDELMWTSSMPCALSNNIAIADFGLSHLGKMKELYRRGLKLRYNEQMQVIAGIHFNFSLSDEFWQILHICEKSSLDLQEFKNRKYLKIIRNFIRYAWIQVFFQGASPCLDQSFSSAKPLKLKCYGDTYYSKIATSFRMSPIGYSNERQKDIIIDWRNLDTYISSISKLVKTQSKKNSYIPIVNSQGEYQQISQSILQIENEYYNIIRPKVKQGRNIPPSYLLKNYGIDYLELRCLDIDPFSLVGINKENLVFLKYFLLFCLLIKEDSSFCVTEAKKNLVNISLKGRDEKLKVSLGERNILAREFLKNFLESFFEFLSVFSSSLNNFLLEKQEEVLGDKPILSQKVEQAINHSGSFIEFNLKQAEKFRQEFLLQKIDSNLEKIFIEMTKQSLEKEKQVIKEEEETFDEYLKNYFSYYQK